MNSGRPLNKTSSDVSLMSWAFVWWWKAQPVAAYWILLRLNAVPNIKSSPETLNHLPPEWLWFRTCALFWIFNSSPNWFLSQSPLFNSWSFPGFWILSQDSLSSSRLFILSLCRWITQLLHQVSCLMEKHSLFCHGVLIFNGHEMPKCPEAPRGGASPW